LIKIIFKFIDCEIVDDVFLLYKKLKKDLFREKKEKQDFLNTIFQILDTQLSIDNIINDK